MKKERRMAIAALGVVMSVVGSVIYLVISLSLPALNSWQQYSGAGIFVLGFTSLVVFISGLKDIRA